jgi:hypothetical protein
MEPNYRAIFCSHCDLTHIYRTSVVQGCQVFERVKCPKCSRPLKMIRADTGYELIVSKPGNIGEPTRDLEQHTYADNASVPIESSEEVLEA